VDSLYICLQDIRERPEYYLEEKSIEYLFQFIVGYSSGANLHHNYLYGFDGFVHSYYCDKNKLLGRERDVFIGTRNWMKMIVEESNCQEEAFNMFYKLLDEFTEAKKRREEMPKDSLYIWLEKIRERPALYLGKKSLTYLFYFIKGYCTAVNYDCITGFDEFVYSHYCNKKKLVGVERDLFIENSNWMRIIIAESKFQEEAFDRFYELFDEFIEVNTN